MGIYEFVVLFTSYLLSPEKKRKKFSQYIFIPTNKIITVNHYYETLNKMF